IRDILEQFRELFGGHQRGDGRDHRPSRVLPEQVKTMNAEIESDSDQLLSIRQDALGLMSGLSDAQFNWQPGPGRWSMAGCFDHLNKSAAQLFIPNIDAAIANATTQGLKSDGPFAY